MNDKSLITKMPERVRTTFSGARRPTKLSYSTTPPKMGRTLPELLDNHRAERRAKAIVDAQVNHRVEDT